MFEREWLGKMSASIAYLANFLFKDPICRLTLMRNVSYCRGFQHTRVLRNLCECDSIGELESCGTLRTSAGTLISSTMEESRHELSFVAPMYQDSEMFWRQTAFGRMGGNSSLKHLQDKYAKQSRTKEDCGVTIRESLAEFLRALKSSYFGLLSKTTSTLYNNQWDSEYFADFTGMQ